MEEPWAGQDSGLIRVNLGHFHSLLNILGMISNNNENNKHEYDVSKYLSEDMKNGENGEYRSK